MSVITTLVQRLRLPLIRGPACGWIGIDVGTRLIKLAQLERNNDTWQLVRYWTIGNGDDSDAGQESVPLLGLGDRAARIKEVRGMFRGRTAAAALPTGCTELRSLEVPASSRSELLSMVEQELAAEASSAAAEIDFDAWETEKTDAGSKVIAVSSERSLGMALARDLWSAGVQCAVIDCAACAIARAVRLCDPAAREEPVAALDFGDSTAMLTVVHGDRPVFCRVLRNCGLQSLTRRLQDKLNVHRSECEHLLTRYGLSGGGQTETAGAIFRIISPSLNQLVEELKRTFHFIRHQSPHWLPQRLWLLGGGATISNLPEFLGARLEMPAALWKLPGNGRASESIEPLLGMAAGLSLLAWEGAACT